MAKLRGICNGQEFLFGGKDWGLVRFPNTYASEFRKDGELLVRSRVRTAKRGEDLYRKREAKDRSALLAVGVTEVDIVVRHTL
jgi:hypothetical protein